MLVSDRLDGPLVRCLTCGLHFVLEDLRVDSGSQTGEQIDAGDEMARLAQRALELKLVEPAVEESERPWREVLARERLEDL